MTTTDKLSSRKEPADGPTRRTVLQLGAAAIAASLLPARSLITCGAAAPTVEPLTLVALKLRSEAAQAILIKHFGLNAQSVFLAERSGNYHGLVVVCDCPVKGGIRGCDCQCSPLAGTPMTGSMSGYEQPEWDEETLLEHLQNQISWTTRTDKPEMTDDEWEHAVEVAGVAPFDPIAWEQHIRQEEEDFQSQRKLWASNRAEAC